jgi:uncharacterized membrane protein
VGGVDPRLSAALTAHASVVASVSAAHSLWARGPRRTLLFAALGGSIPFLGELLAIHILKVLRHHARPQIGGVPLAVALGWYNIGYNAFSIAEHLLAGKGDRVLAPAAALVATDLDLLLDPCGLDLGLWEWSRSGPYAAEVEGPNGSHGIPAFSFAGWIGLISGVALAYRRLVSDAPRPAGGRTPALLLLSYYLPAAAWASRRRRRRYLVYSAAALLAVSRATTG